MRTKKDTRGVNYLSVKKFCLNQGADLFGVAAISDIKHTFLISQGTTAKLNSAVSLGVRLSSSVLGEIGQAPTRLYFHHYRTVNVFLDQLALKLTNFIQKQGFSALPIPASQILDWQNQRAHLSHKQIGHLAGLGWIGRNNLLVNKKLGSQFRLVSVLTDMAIKEDVPCEDGCGKCFLCVKACPARSIKEEKRDFDHIGCFEKLKDFQKQRLVDQYICGVCVNVCKGKS